MKRGVKVSLICGVAFVVLAAAVFVAVVMLSREPMVIGKSAAADVPKACRAVRIVTSVIAQIEKSDATRIILCGGERVGDYAEFLAHAGLPVVTNEMKVTARDIVFAASAADLARFMGKAKVMDGALYVACVDARGMLASRFKEEIVGHPGAVKHVWMPGAADWVLTGVEGDEKFSLAEMMDVFSREGLMEDLVAAECDGLADVFASYVGTAEDILPAFENVKDAIVRADNFVTREVPSFDWLSVVGVEEDIRREVMAQIRTAQVVRRVMLEGMYAADRGKEEEAVAAFARVALRNPRDTMLVERMTHLRVNAQTFEKVGNDTLAAHCYETIARIYPNDPAPLEAFARCVERLGKKELAVQAHVRARALTKALEGAARR